MGMDLLLGVAFAFVVLGPKRVHSVLGLVGRAKAEIDKAAGSVKARLGEELEGPGVNEPFTAEGAEGAEEFTS